MRNHEVFVRALRAAAATTGVLKRSASIGLVAGTLVLAGCGGSKGASAQPPSGAGDPVDTSATTTAPDAAVAAEVTCEDDPGYSSKCCEAQREAGLSPMACTPWGPPAPPAYAGERLA